MSLLFFIYILLWFIIIVCFITLIIGREENDGNQQLASDAVDKPVVPIVCNDEIKDL